jgi:hypothetical protein
LSSHHDLRPPCIAVAYDRTFTRTSAIAALLTPAKPAAPSVSFAAELRGDGSPPKIRGGLEPSMAAQAEAIFFAPYVGIAYPFALREVVRRRSA